MIDIDDDGEISRAEWQTAWMQALANMDRTGRKRLETVDTSQGGAVEMKTLAPN